MREAPRVQHDEDARDQRDRRQDRGDDPKGKARSPPQGRRRGHDDEDLGLGVLLRITATAMLRSDPQVKQHQQPLGRIRGEHSPEVGEGDGATIRRDRTLGPAAVISQN